MMSGEARIIGWPPRVRHLRPRLRGVVDPVGIVETHRAAAATLACLVLVFVVLLFASRVSAGSWLEDSGRASAEASQTKPDERKWALTLYGGPLTTDSTRKISNFSADYKDSHIGVAALSWQFAKLTRHLRFEVEGQVAKHFGDQDHWELNALVIARWVTFPWNAYLGTTVALGEGISYATEIPRLEDKPRASQWLNYLLYEFTFALPAHPEWSLVVRVHHRSGFYGELASNSMNAVALGIKYRF